MNPIERLAARLTGVERELYRRKTPQLAHSSIEDGALRSNALDGTETMVIGKQFDGTQAAAVVAGPPPPKPMPPVAEGTIAGVKVTVSGLFADGFLVPMDFGRFEVHGSTNPNFEVDLATTLLGSTSTPRGGEFLFALPTVAHYFRIVARSQSGKGSVPSEMVSATPRLIAATDIDPEIDLGTGGPDGEVPTSSPAVLIDGISNAVTATWTATPNADPVTYRVYTSNSTIPDNLAGALLFTETMATQIVIPTTTRVYVRVVATDADGPATTVGAEGTGLPDTIEEFHIEPLSITSDLIADYAVPVKKLLSTQHHIY